MAACAVCGGKASPITGFSCADGRVCRECAEKLPSIARKAIKGMPGLDVRLWAAHGADAARHRKEFAMTASYGSLQVDEWHGLFAICDKKLMDGDALPPSCLDVFSPLCLDDYGFVLKDPEPKEHSVMVSVAFVFIMGRPPLKSSISIKTANCYAHRVDDLHISYREPSELTLFRSIFAHAIDVAHEREKGLPIHGTRGGDALLAAMRAFYLDGPYSLDEIKDRKKRLLRAFRPESAASDAERAVLSRISEEVAGHYKVLRKEIMA